MTEKVSERLEKVRYGPGFLLFANPWLRQAVAMLEKETATDRCPACGDPICEWADGTPYCGCTRARGCHHHGWRAGVCGVCDFFRDLARALEGQDCERHD